MPSQVDIINMALDQISANVTIQSISPPRPQGLAAEVAARNWQLRVDGVSRGAHWDCLRFQQDLTVLKAAPGMPENPNGAGPRPPLPFLYEYAYPTDCLLMRFLIPQINYPGTVVPLMTNVGAPTISAAITALPFVRAFDLDANGRRVPVILTNAPRAQGVYTARVNDPNLWDAGLQNAIVAVLAAWFVNPIAADRQRLSDQVGIAKTTLDEGRAQNGNEGITNVDHYPDWMAIRNNGVPTDYDAVGTTSYFTGWSSVALPGLSY